jgi:hypothetical protein
MEEGDKEMTGWKVKSPGLAQPDNHVQCSLTIAPTVFIEPLPRQKIDQLMVIYPHSEWAGYMVGRVVEQNIFVEDISIPPHKPGSVSGGSAEVAEPKYNAQTGKYDFYIPARCVGFIHSHDSLGAFHSGTDDAHVDRNYPVSITVARRSADQQTEFSTVFFGVTPCGKALMGTATVKYVAQKPYNIEDWIKQARANIERTDIKVEVYTGFREAVRYTSPQPKKAHWNEQPRDEYGHFLPRLDDKLDRLARSMSRKGSIHDLFVDGSGVVLSPEEVQQMLDKGG